MYVNPDLKNSVIPTINQVKKYLKSANTVPQQGIERDVRPLMSFLQRLPEFDSYLGGLILTRKMSVKAKKFDIVLSDEFTPTDTELKQLAETKVRFRRSQMRESIDDIMDGVLYGQSAVRLVWENTNFGTMVTNKETLDLTELDFSEETDSLVGVSSVNGKLIKEELDPDIYLITRFNPIKNRKNYIGSFMRSVMLLSFLKYNNRWDWRDLNKRHGVPSTFATHPEGIDDEEVGKLISMVEKLKNDAVAVFPDYVKILYDEALKTDSTNSFKDFINACNLELAIAIHGQNLTTEVTQGSRAAATVHDKVDSLITISDSNVVDAVFTNQYLKQDYLLNYGEPRNDFFQFKFLEEVQEDYESNSRIITNILSDPEAKKELPLKKSEVYEKLGFTQPNENDETI